MASGRSQRPSGTRRVEEFAFEGCEGGHDPGGGLDGAADGDASGAVMHIGPMPE